MKSLAILSRRVRAFIKENLEGSGAGMLACPESVRIEGATVHLRTPGRSGKGATMCAR